MPGGGFSFSIPESFRYRRSCRGTAWNSRVETVWGVLIRCHQRTSEAVFNDHVIILSRTDLLIIAS
ncbi:hypothetical protein RRSWK_03837 [Rhodopirellula sp. SWK7]|nr:hypothetical protein RRSWK_03837 [Rhodopirellula sp. SWK7]